jgi:hypothetical protein
MRLNITRTETYTVDVDAADIREACDKYGIPSHVAYTMEELLTRYAAHWAGYSWEQVLAYLASGQDADGEVWELETWTTE